MFSFHLQIFSSIFHRKSEAMNRPRKEFVPTSLSDLNIDAISLSSNGDRHNNNSNGARFNNLNRSTSKSSYNLASYQKQSHNSSDHFSRSKHFYGSQSNISSNQSVNSFNINSPSSGLDRWEQAWEDNNNNYRQSSSQRQEFSFDKPNTLDFKTPQTTSNRSMNRYVDDPFDDPWSGISKLLFQSLSLSAHLSHSICHALNLLFFVLSVAESGKFLLKH